MSVHDRFTAFLENIRLTIAQKADGSTKRESVCWPLNYFYYSSNSKTANSRYVGSWDKRTRIRPPRDVDILFMLPASTYQRFEGRSGNKQSQILQEVKGILTNSFPNTKIKGDGPVVLVPFTSYAVEVLPAFKLTDGKYYICNTANGGKYDTTDPDAEITKITESNTESSNNTRDLVRMLKCWQAECAVPIKSFWLELLSIEFLTSWPNKGKSKTYYDWMVRDFFRFMIGKSNSYIIVPGTYEIIYIGELWKSRAESAYNRSVNAVEHENANPPRPYSALEEWRKIFGNYIS